MANNVLKEAVKRVRDIPGTTNKVETLNNGIYRIVDSDGNILGKKCYSSIGNFISGFAVVSYRDKYGIINCNGDECVPRIYDNIHMTEKGLVIRICKDDLWGYMDLYFNVVIEPKFTFLESFKGKYARIKDNNLWGVIHISGKVVIEPIYDFIGEANRSRILIKNHEGYGIIDIHENVLEETMYDKIFDLDGQTIIMDTKSGKRVIV